MASPLAARPDVGRVTLETRGGIEATMTTISQLPTSRFSFPNLAVVRPLTAEAAPAITLGKVLRATGLFLGMAVVVAIGIALPFLFVGRARGCATSVGEA